MVVAEIQIHTPMTIPLSAGGPNYYPIVACILSGAASHSVIWWEGSSPIELEPVELNVGELVTSAADFGVCIKTIQY